MKYHKQEQLYYPDTYPNGSCYPTVYACILDIELNQVPYFNLLYFETSKIKENLEKYAKFKYLKGKDYDECEESTKVRYDEFLAFDVERLWNDVRTYWLAAMGYTEDYVADIEKWLLENPEREYIAHGISPRNVGHVVVYKNGEMIHDPHPSNSGLVKIDYFSYLRKVEGDYEWDRYYKRKLTD